MCLPLSLLTICRDTLANLPSDIPTIIPVSVSQVNSQCEYHNAHATHAE